jgi:hypothetical protein
VLPALLEPNRNVCQEIAIHNTIENALFRLVDKLRGLTVARTTSVINGKSEGGAILTPHPIGPQLDPNRFPTLSYFGVPLDDDRINSAILQDVYKRNRDLTSSTTLYIEHPSGGSHTTLVTIPKPKSSSLDLLRRK